MKEYLSVNRLKGTIFCFINNRILIIKVANVIKARHIVCEFKLLINGEIFAHNASTFTRKDLIITYFQIIVTYLLFSASQNII